MISSVLETYAHNHQTCLTYLHVTVPMACTIVLGAITTILWIIWDNRRMKKEEEEYVRSQTELEPLEIEEIPRKFLHFQKLCIQLTLHSMTAEDHDYILNELIQWMNTNNHPNFTDVFTIITDTNEEYTDDPNIIQWINTALYVWSKNPRWRMPHIKCIMPRSRSWTVA